MLIFMKQILIIFVYQTKKKQQSVWQILFIKKSEGLEGFGGEGGKVKKKKGRNYKNKESNLKELIINEHSKIIQLKHKNGLRRRF